MRNKAELYDRLEAAVSRTRYNGTELGNKLIACAASIAPQCGFDNLAQIIPLITAAIFANAGIDVDHEKIVSSSPSNDTIKRLVQQHAIDNLILTKDSVDKCCDVYLSIDKGNKHGNKNMPKFLCWYNVEEKKTKKFNPNKSRDIYMDKRIIVIKGV